MHRENERQPPRRLKQVAVSSWAIRAAGLFLIQPAEHYRIKKQFESAPRLRAVLRAKAEQDDPSFSQVHIDESRFARHVLRPEQPA